MRREEDQIHKVVCCHLQARGAPNLVWWHTPNAPRGKIAGWRLKRLGMRAGVSDLVFVHKGRVFALELKATKGRPSEAQMQFISDINAAGGFGCIVHGLDKALKTLETWGLIRGEAA